MYMRGFFFYRERRSIHAFMSSAPAIPLTYDSAIQKHLKPGERLLGVTRPHQGWAYRWHNRLLFVQVAWALAALWWLLKLALWSAGSLGVDLGLPNAPPTGLHTVVVLAGGVVVVRQLLLDRQRRAGTWYAATDQRLLFVLTNVSPESVIAVEYGEITNLRLNRRDDVPAPARDVISFDLKHVDPYLCNSTVLGYQIASGAVVLENVADARDLFELIRHQVAAAAHHHVEERAAAPTKRASTNDQR